MRILSPSLMNRGTRISAPVSTVAGFRVLVAAVSYTHLVLAALAVWAVLSKKLPLHRLVYVLVLGFGLLYSLSLIHI